MGEINDVLCDYFGIAEHNADFWNSTEFYQREPIAAASLRPCDRIHTVALYCGIEEYDGALNVLGLMNMNGLGADSLVYPNSYPFKIYSLKDLPEERFQTSLREIIAVFKRCSDKDALLEYYNMHKERFQQLDELSIEVMGILIGRENLTLFSQEGKGMDMCKAFRDAIEEGRVEGQRERGLEDIRSLMVNLKLTAQQAMDALSIPKNEQAEYLSLI